MRITAQQIRVENGKYIIYVSGEGFADFERSFNTRESAVSWINALIALVNMKEKIDE